MYVSLCRKHYNDGRISGEKGYGEGYGDKK